jgi:hypothetical protein
MPLPGGSEISWRTLRRMRSDPPGAASRSQHRRQTFGAALEQGEELWSASSSVGSMVSPIILFYGLTQVARALAAARVTGGHWEGKPSHGLRLFKPDLSLEGTPQLREVVVRDEGRGFIQQVADVLGSPTIPEATTLVSRLKG